MKHRKLRIAWTVAWGIVAVLLLVLWIRSYWTYDIFGVTAPSADEFSVHSSGDYIGFIYGANFR